MEATKGTSRYTGGGGTLSVAIATTDADGRAATTLTLDRQAGANTVAGWARLVAMARELIGLPDGPQPQQNAPNPFNSGTVITGSLTRSTARAFDALPGFR